MNGIRLLSSLTFAFWASFSQASTISLQIGDNDGFGSAASGFDFPDGAPINDFLNIVGPSDNRDEIEQDATDGSQYTDTYAPYFIEDIDALIGFGPINTFEDFFNAGLTNIAEVIFPFDGVLSSGVVSVDIGDYRFEDQLWASIDGLDYDFGPAVTAYAETGVISHTLSADQLAIANDTGQVVLRLELALIEAVGEEFVGAGDLITIDYFRFDGELDDVTPEPGPTPVPLPAGGLLLLSSFCGLAVFKRRQKRAG